MTRLLEVNAVSSCSVSVESRPAVCSGATFWSVCHVRVTVRAFEVLNHSPVHRKQLNPGHSRQSVTLLPSDAAVRCVSRKRTAKHAFTVGGQSATLPPSVPRFISSMECNLNSLRPVSPRPSTTALPPCLGHAKGTVPAYSLLIAFL
jgi:hypothetical protein